MTRKALFDAVRPFAPKAEFTSDDVRLINQIAHRWGIPEDDARSLKPSRAALEIIKRFEGCELKAYPDPGTGGDPWTIGWGATGSGIRKGVVWTQEQADQRLAVDVDRFAQGVAEFLKGAFTDQHQFDAMVSLTYNVGPKAFANSTLLEKHRAGDFEGAANEFRRWVFAGGRKLNGLVKRRAAEAALYRGIS